MHRADAELPEPATMTEIARWMHHGAFTASYSALSRTSIEEAEKYSGVRLQRFARNDVLAKALNYMRFIE